MTWDVFVSYASDDRDEIVALLVAELLKRGISAWYDDLALKPGDKLNESIDLGISKSQVAILVLSPSYFEKGWTRYEYNGLIQRHVEEDVRLIPIWHNLSKMDVSAYSPTLANIIALNSSLGPSEIANRIATIILPTPRTEIRNVFRTSVPYASGIESSLEKVLMRFIVDNPVFKLNYDSSGIQHEYGYGGYSERRMSIVDNAQVELFTILVKDQWDTYSDDSSDFALPTIISIFASGPLFDQVSRECTDEVNRSLKST